MVVKGLGAWQALHRQMDRQMGECFAGCLGPQAGGVGCGGVAGNWLVCLGHSSGELQTTAFPPALSPF